MIVVTGSRIVRDGFNQPTPTTIMSTQDLEAAAVPNIANFVNQLPALSGTVTPTVNNAMTSSGNTGQNFLDLRGLGANRTLVLLDGRRIVPTATSGSSDINNIPSQLVSRVDVVTGGASAAYGSDAVAGVVNFILDTKFTGFKAEVQAGISSRSDNEIGQASLTFGTPLGDRFHLLLSGMVSETPGIEFFDREKRRWNTGMRRLPNPAFVSSTATPDIPATLLFNNVNNALSAAGGLITSGPARGIQFGVGGEQMPFEYGSPIIGTFMVGGQYGDTADQTTFVSAVRIATGFGRLSYDLDENTTLFAQFNYGYSLGRGWGSPQRRFGNVTIKSDNAFLPESIRDLACPAAGPNTNCFSFGTDNADLSYRYDGYRHMAIGGGRNRVQRQTYIATAGINGKLFGNWNWDTYYQFGRSDVDMRLGNNQIMPNYNKAVDAVRNTAGDIVCRVNADANPANDDPACAPLNLFGIDVASPEAKAYVLGTAQQQLQLTQQVAEVTLSGDLFNLWAGPVSVAGGVGWRNEKVVTPFVDPLALSGSYFAANYKPTVGAYTVKELFGEVLVPIAKGLPLLNQLDLNGAVRLTDYSTSGTVTTYKAGINYRPMEDILVRGTLSRDIRAPNLSELYSGGTTGLNPATDPRYSNAAISVPTASVGNAALVPEIAKSLGVGIVYQPSWLRGFSVSVDYYEIRLSDAIANIGLQQVLNLCESGARPDFCAMVVRGAGTVGGVSVPDAVLSATVGPVNIASVKTSGVDVEFAYRKQLSDWVPGWDAAITLRALGTHIKKYISNNGLGTIHDSAGETGSPTSGLPDWRWRTTLNYQQGAFDVTLSWRRISSGVFSNSFFDNAAGPLTVDDNHIEGADYFDLTAQYSPYEDGRLKMFVSVKNLFDKDPPVAPAVASYLYVQYNPSLFDGIGTFINAGVRVKF